MSTLTAQTIDLIKMLPEEELQTVNSLLKMLVRSWDPDFSKVTPKEREKLERIFLRPILLPLVAYIQDSDADFFEFPVLSAYLPYIISLIHR